MTFFEWFKGVNNTYVTNANAPTNNPYQCMQLMHNYVVSVLGLPETFLSAYDARQVYLNFPRVLGADHFIRIPNGPFNIPKQGDIVFFGSGPDGHVCIFNEGNWRRFSSIDQNWPVHSPVHVQEHTYGFLGKDVLGWLRCIKEGI